MRNKIIFAVMLLALISAVTAYNFPTPVAVYPMDSTNLGYEIMESGYNGTNNGVTRNTTSKKWGASSGTFDDDFLDIGSDAYGITTGNWSFLLWFKTSNTAVNRIFGKQADATHRNIQMRLNTAAAGNLYFATYDGATEDTLGRNDTNTGFTDGNWHSLAGTYNSDGAGSTYLYLDGIPMEKDTGGASVTTLVSTAKLYIGNWEQDTSGGFIGEIDEFTFFDTLITADNITAWENSGGYKVYAGLPAAVSNFTVSMTDSYNSSQLNISIDIEFNGSTYNVSGNATVDTGLRNVDKAANLTIRAEGYDTRTYTNYNINNDLSSTMNLTYGRFIFDHNLKNVGTGVNVSNFTVNFTDSDNGTVWSFSTTGQELIGIVPKNKTYEVMIDAYEYALYYVNKTYAQEINITLETLYLYETNSIYTTFYDEQTGLLIDFETVSMDIIGDLFANNYSTSSGKINVTLLLPSDYLIRYSAPSYKERFTSITVEDKSYDALVLYLLNSSNADNITITVIDQNAQPLEDATVKALKYNLSANSYIIMEQADTDINGRSTLYVEKNTEFYKFVVQYNGVTLKTTAPQYITQDAYTIQVTIGDSIVSDFDKYRSIDYTLDFNTATNNFRTTYNDVTGFTTRICLKAYRVEGSGVTQVNKSCSYSGAASLLAGVQAVNGTYYVGKLFYYDSEGEHYLDETGYTFPLSIDFGNEGLFIQLLLTLTLAAIAIWSLPLSLLLTPFSLLLGRAIYLNAIGWEYLIPLQVVGLIIAIMLWRRS